MSFDWLIKIGYVLLGLFIVLNYGLLQYGVIRRISARIGKRIGVKVYQPYIDLIKNYSFRSQITHGVMFYLGPVFRLSGGVGVFLFMPLIFGSEHFSNYSFSGDLILILYFLFFGMLGMALGAGEGGHPYSFIGISRGLSQFTTIELPFTLAVISLAIQYHTFSITDIVAAQQGGIMHWTLMTNPLATAAAMLSFLGMMGNSPFNVVIAPQENPIGPPTEYHSTFLAVLQTNRAILGPVEAILMVNLFFGGATNWVSLIIKSFLVFFWPVFVGIVFPRFRVDQSIPWFLKLPFVLGILAIFLI
ncbi:MAG: NADH-quinone oxidoreductase subunit H [Bacteroidales bacterium]|nr:NADH-quinone oxidoreductase subunit H [Bacteroidales bacterium]